VVEQCGGYTSTTGDLYVGDASSGSHAWSYSHVVAGGCARPHRLYCFRTQAAGKIQPPVQKGRRVFVSPRPFVVGSTDPTEFCAREAAEAGLADPGNFVAFLATGGSPALKLIGSTGPWKRLDEVIVAGQASDFANGRLLAPINLGPDGFTYLPNRVWTGATYSSAEGSATCGDWTGISASALVGDSRTTAAPAWFSLGEAGSVPCKDENTHLMCIEP
jgi:hypothetical protein